VRRRSDVWDRFEIQQKPVASFFQQLLHEALNALAVAL
jgi:hypothetical protein